MYLCHELCLQVPGQLLLHSHNPIIECLSNVLFEALGQLEVVDTHLLTNTLLIQVEGCLQTLNGDISMKNVSLKYEKWLLSPSLPPSLSPIAYLHWCVNSLLEAPGPCGHASVVRLEGCQ